MSAALRRLITDFTRRTQPVIRYRLDDVLVAATEPCPCGQPTRVLEAIEGRRDDQLLLPCSERHARVYLPMCAAGRLPVRCR